MSVYKVYHSALSFSLFPLLHHYIYIHYFLSLPSVITFCGINWKLNRELWIWEYGQLNCRRLFYSLCMSVCLSFLPLFPSHFPPRYISLSFFLYLCRFWSSAKCRSEGFWNSLDKNSFFFTKFYYHDQLSQPSRERRDRERGRGEVRRICCPIDCFNEIRFKANTVWANLC